MLAITLLTRIISVTLGAIFSRARLAASKETTHYHAVQILDLSLSLGRRHRYVFGASSKSLVNLKILFET